MSLKLKVSLLFSALLLVVIAALTSILIWTEEKALSQNIQKRQRDLAGGLTEVCRSTFYSQQDLLMTNYLKRLKSLPEVMEARCFDREGHVVGHTEFTLIQSVLPPGERTRPSSPTGAYAEFSQPVQVGEAVLGTAQVFFSQDVLDEMLKENLEKATLRILQVAVPACLTGFLGAFLVTGWVIRPIRRLMNGARKIGDGQLGHRIPVRSRDEIGALGSEFNRMAERLGELDQMKSDFVNSITHDLKSPLTTIDAAVESSEKIAKKMPDDAPDRQVLIENLFMVRQKSNGLRNLVTSILEMAHIESGLALNKKPILMEEIAHRVVESFSLIAQQKGISLNLLVSAALPAVMGDEGKWERALSNLVGNAVKFTDEGGVVVEVERQGNEGLIRVKDSGPGIASGFQERLFSKFSRSREAAASKVEGTGLGLSIVKGIVEAHGGKIRAENLPVRGAIFTISIPLGRGHA